MADRVSSIKRAQKESLLMREIAQLFHEAALDDPRLSALTINRVQLSPDKGTCRVLFYTADGKAGFDKLLGTLILYKPSLRAAIAKRVQSRYAPELIFAFDEQFEKEMKIQALLDKIKEEQEK